MMKTGYLITGGLKIFALVCSITFFCTGLSAAQLERIPSPKSFSADEVHFIVFGDSRKNVLVGKDRYDEDKVRSARRYNHFRHLVFSDVAASLEKREADFTLFTGDFIWMGGDKKQWQEIHRYFPRGLRSNGSAQMFPVLGNHELLQEPGKQDALKNYFATFPYLTDGGKGLHNYYFTVGSNLFVSLCSGNTTDDEKKVRRELDQYWNCDCVVSFDSLMLELLSLLDGVMLEDGLQNVFVQYHKPSFSNSVHPPLNSSFDPLMALGQWKKEHPEVNVAVFNGHNHTTEMYRTQEGILVMVTGGGGASQDGYLAAHQHTKQTPDELFWQTLGKVEREPRINYFRVDIDAEGQAVIREMVLVIDGGLFPHLKTHFAEGVRILANGEMLPPVIQLESIRMKRLLHARMGAR